MYGARFVAGALQRRLHLSPDRSRLLVLGWLVACATLYQVLVGFTPLSLLYRVPQVTDHERLLARFAREIPADGRSLKIGVAGLAAHKRPVEV